MNQRYSKRASTSTPTTVGGEGTIKSNNYGLKAANGLVSSESRIFILGWQ